MLGVYDHPGHSQWTFDWLQRRGGKALLEQFWDEAVHRDSQRHAADLIVQKGIAGMKEYWGHVLEHENTGYATTATETVFRIDMHRCTSREFLIQNKLDTGDFCDHCMGWIGPLLKRAGYVVDHQHNHRGQCWWEIYRENDTTAGSKPGGLAGPNDVRLFPNWQETTSPIDTYLRAHHPDQKSPAT